MAKRKIVTRTYMTKKGLVTKQYSYKAKSPLLFRKYKGKYIIVKKNYDKFINDIKTDTSLSKAEKTTMINEVEAERLLIERGGGRYSSAAQFGANRIDESSMMSRIAATKTEKFIRNLGYDPEDLANELGINVDELLDSANWSGDTLNIGKESWEFTFKYNGTPYVKK